MAWYRPWRTPHGGHWRTRRHPGWPSRSSTTAGRLGGRLRGRRLGRRGTGDARDPLPGRLGLQAGHRLGRAAPGRAGPDRPGRAGGRPPATLAPPTVAVRPRRHLRPSAAQPHRRPVGARLCRTDAGAAPATDRGLAVRGGGRELPGGAAGGTGSTLAVLGWRLQRAAAACRGAHRPTLRGVHAGRGAGRLGMAASSFWWRRTAATAYPHAADGGRIPDFAFAEQAAAGLVTTAPDLARFVAAALSGPDGEPPGRGVVRPAGLRLALTAAPGTEGRWGLGYGLGFLPSGERLAYHEGANRGWRAGLALLPDRRAGMVVLANSDAGSAPVTPWSSSGCGAGRRRDNSGEVFQPRFGTASMVEGQARTSDAVQMTDRVRLGRSDLEVPRLGVGAMTWGSPSGRSRWGPARLAYGGTPGSEEERRAFQASLSAGVEFFDTAAMYSAGASERRLGELAEGKRVVIATKFPPGWLSTAEALSDALDQSLARLRRSRIDLYQHHFPSRRVPIPSLMGLMADAVEAGKVRAVGVSNYSARQLRVAHAALAERGVPLASNQVEYSLLHRAPEVNGVLDACTELGITLIAYQPLAQGVLTGKYRPGDRPKGVRRFGRYYRGDGL